MISKRRQTLSLLCEVPLKVLSFEPKDNFAQAFFPVLFWYLCFYPCFRSAIWQFWHRIYNFNQYKTQQFLEELWSWPCIATGNNATVPMKKFAAAAKAPSVVFSSVSTEVQIGHVLSTYVPKHRSSTSKSPKTIRDSDSWWTRIVTEMGEVLQTINVHCALCAFIWGKCKFEYTNLVNTYKAATWACSSFLCAFHRAAWGRLAT